MRQCFFCSQNLRTIDYKEVELLKRFISGQGKIIDPRHTGTCAKHQRLLAQAIKRARFMGLLPFVKR
jgi:small subunit ribosomal protein S18